MNGPMISQHPAHNTYSQQLPLQQQIPSQHQYTSTNQSMALQQYQGVQGPMQPSHQFSTHPASAFTPIAAENNNSVVQQTFAPHTNNGQNIPNAQHTPEIKSVSLSNITPAPSMPSFNTGNQATNAPPASIQTQLPRYTPVSSQQNIQHNSIPEAFNSTQPVTTQIGSPPVTTQSAIFQPTPMMPPGNCEDPSSLIFSPPNVVNYSNQQRPATQPDLNTYIAPTKAAGDVSLSGPQLVNFLIKATMRLQQGTMREGIQLNLSQLNDLVMAGQLSEACIKKLNFVVDALDRGAYDEGQSFFDQLQINFPNETTGMKWAQGVKFLILELKKQRCSQATMDHHSQVPRIGSAGTRTM